MTIKRVRKFAIAGISLLVFSLLHKFIFTPIGVRIRLHQLVEIKPNKFRRGIWNAFPVPLEFHVYLYNVTNPNEITNGQKPILQQIGPFVYDQYEDKSNQNDRNEDDSVAFNHKFTNFFNAEKSNGLTGDEELVVPNYFILGLVNKLKIEKPTAVPVIGKGVDSIFQKPSSIFIKAKAKELLFDGFIINCTVKDFAGAAICSEVRDTYEDLGLKKIGEDMYLMSLFGAANGTADRSSVRVLRGNKKLSTLGNVIEFNDQTNISTWDDHYCDMLNGTDGTVYHPRYKKKDYLGVFVGSMCKVFNFDFVDEVKCKGLTCFRYTTDLGTDPNNNPDEMCYCTDPSNCVKKGAFDTYKCTKVPLIVTNPHFYLADPYYLSLVDGLHPDKEIHALSLDIEPFSGTPIAARTKVQANMFLKKIEKFKLMKNMPEALFPLVWMDKQMDLPDYLVKVTRQGLMLVTLAKIFFYLCFLSGLGFSSCAGFMHYRSMRKKKSMEIQKAVQPVSEIISESSKNMTLNPINLQAAQVPASID